MFDARAQLFRQWVAIVDPKSVKDKGVQGYLKLSITVIGPGKVPLGVGRCSHRDTAEHMHRRGRLSCFRRLTVWLLLYTVSGDSAPLHSQADIEAKDAADDAASSSKDKKGKKGTSRRLCRRDC